VQTVETAAGGAGDAGEQICLIMHGLLQTICQYTVMVIWFESATKSFESGLFHRRI